MHAPPHRIRTALLSAALALLTTSAHAGTATIDMTLVTADGVGQPIGKIVATDTTAGLRLVPDLTGLPPGDHGFHVHEKPSCAPGPDADKGGAPAPAFGAGGHLDPEHTQRHAGPEGAGHKGDLPALTVGTDGRATTAVVAPHLTAADLQGHALMIHAGGDNYADLPVKLGGGGGRIACGVVS